MYLEVVTVLLAPFAVAFGKDFQTNAVDRTVKKLVHTEISHIKKSYKEEYVRPLHSYYSSFRNKMDMDTAGCRVPNT